MFEPKLAVSSTYALIGFAQSAQRGIKVIGKDGTLNILPLVQVLKLVCKDHGFLDQALHALAMRLDLVIPAKTMCLSVKRAPTPTAKPRKANTPTTGQRRPLACRERQSATKRCDAHATPLPTHTTPAEASSAQDSALHLPGSRSPVDAPRRRPRTTAHSPTAAEAWFNVVPGLQPASANRRHLGDHGNHTTTPIPVGTQPLYVAHRRAETAVLYSAHLLRDRNFSTMAISERL